MLAADGGFGKGDMFYASHIDINAEELDELDFYIIEYEHEKGLK